MPIAVYESVSCYLIATLPVAIDGLVMLIVGQFIVLFKCVGENFVKIVNEFDVSERSLTVEKMNKAIDSHKILDLSAEIFKMYEVPLLVHVLTQALSIGFVLFTVLVSFYSN
jgi:hypothetical protein